MLRRTSVSRTGEAGARLRSLPLPAKAEKEEFASNWHATFVMGKLFSVIFHRADSLP